MEPTFRPFPVCSLASTSLSPLHIAWKFHRKWFLRALVFVMFGICVIPIRGYSQEVVFKAPVAYLSNGANETSVTVADLNGDGKPDLVIANFCTSGDASCGNNTLKGVVSVLLGNGDGTFQTAVTYGSGGYDPHWVAVADVNGDGKPDLVVANFCASSCTGNPSPSLVSVLLGNGDGTFQPAVPYGTGGNGTFSLAVADVNGDGKLDIVTTNLCPSDSSNCTNGSVGVLRGNGDGTFQTAVPYDAGGASTMSVAVADVNGDGKPDILVANRGLPESGPNDGGVSVLLGNGDGTFQTAVPYGSGGYGAVSVAVADVKGDGKLDVLVANNCVSFGNCNSANGNVGVLLGNGDGTFQPAAPYNSGGMTTSSVAVADVNGDGKLDLVVDNVCGVSPNQCADGNVGILLGNGDGTFQTPAIYASGGGGAFAVAVADVNRDGKPDLVVNSGCASGCANSMVAVLINAGLTTSITTSSSVNPSVVGQPFVVTTTVTSSGGTPTGNVTFSNGSTVLGTSGLGPSGMATLNTSLSAVGQYTITGSYGGDARFAPNSSSFTQKVNKATTKTLLSSSPNPSVTGQSVTFTAAVVPRFAGTPTGTVTFSETGVGVLATETLSGGSASFTTKFSATGAFKISATYKGDANFVSSVSAFLVQKVNAFPTSTNVTSNLNPSNFGQPVTFTTTVSFSYGTPTGTVTFRRGTTALGTMAMTGNTASFSTSALNAGINSINAVYSGDTNFATSTSPNLSEHVNKIASTTTLSSSENPSNPGQSVTFTATVTAASGTPTGTITFKNGSMTLGTEMLSGGTASFVTSTLPSGSNSIKASYGGSTNYLASSSAALIQTVQ